MFFLEVYFKVRNVPHSEHRDMSDGDFTHAVLNLNAQLIRKHES